MRANDPTNYEHLIILQNNDTLQNNAERKPLVFDIIKLCYSCNPHDIKTILNNNHHL